MRSPAMKTEAKTLLSMSAFSMNKRRALPSHLSGGGGGEYALLCLSLLPDVAKESFLVFHIHHRIKFYLHIGFPESVHACGDFKAVGI